MIYLTSDLHFAHNRSFIYEPRGFKDIWEMNNEIVKNWNSIVKWDDTIYVLGDLMLNDNEEGMILFNNLNGKKKIILGNHDTNARIELYKTLYNTEVIGYADRLDYKGYHFYLSHYPTLTSNLDGDKPLKARIINLCGHCHTKDKWENWGGGCYHIELDCHNNTPVSIEQVVEDIKNKVNK